MPPLGKAAPIGLVLYLICAISTNIRARDPDVGGAIFFLALSPRSSRLSATTATGDGTETVPCAGRWRGFRRNPAARTGGYVTLIGSGASPRLSRIRPAAEEAVWREPALTLGFWPQKFTRYPTFSGLRGRPIRSGGLTTHTCPPSFAHRARRQRDGTCSRDRTLDNCTNAAGALRPFTDGRACVLLLSAAGTPALRGSTDISPALRS